LDSVEERRRRLEEEVKARIDAEKEKKREEKERKKEERKLYAELMKDWHKPKEDLELEDLQDLPVPAPVNCRVPNELFGGLLEILEFFTVFHKSQEFGDYFPSGLTFEKVEEALSDQDMRGGLYELLTALLETIFHLQVGTRFLLRY
jgi:bromodomain adjacent to zinc finger domain protein 1A